MTTTSISTTFPRDPLFQVGILAATPNPQTVCWQGMHQDYSEHYVFDEHEPDEKRAGEICVKRLLAGERGHYGPLEHPQITFSTGFFPHSVMQQARTHRIGVSFDVQSMRYTGKRIIDCADGLLDAEEVFYLRPSGYGYMNREGKKYFYTESARRKDLELCYQSALRYAELVNDGCPEEQARGVLAFDYRQHFVVSFTLRAALHFIDMRHKADAQGEITILADMIWKHLELWVPEIAAYYAEKRLGKARLAP